MKERRETNGSDGSLPHFSGGTMKRTHWSWIGAVVLLVSLLPCSGFALTVVGGWLQTNPQVFPLGDLVDLELIEEGGDIDLASFPDLFYAQISNVTDEEMTQEVYVHAMMVAQTYPEPLMNFYSRPFELRHWMDDPRGSNGSYTNTQLGLILDEGSWLNTNTRDTEYISVDEFMGNVISGSNLIATIYTLTISVYSANDQLLGQYIDPIVIYELHDPELQYPGDGDDIENLPIMFSWNYAGAPNSPSSWNLLLVESQQQNYSPEDLLQNPPLESIRYNDSPTSTESHVYLGVGAGEQSLTPGYWYYWQVSVQITSAIPGDYITRSSNIFGFHYLGSVGGDGFGDTGGGVGGGSGGGGGVTGGSGGGGSGGGRGPGQDDEGSGGFAGQSGQDDDDPNPEDPGDAYRVLDVLVAHVPPELLEQLREELYGYYLTNMIFDGETGKTLNDLRLKIANPDFQIITVEID